MNIFVANLNYKLEEQHLHDAFAKYGEVESAKIITDKFTGRSKGFGFVEMPNEEEGNTAIESLHDYELLGRNMVVRKAKPRD